MLVCGLMRKPYLIPNVFLNFKVVMCHTVRTTHGLQDEAISKQLPPHTGHKKVTAALH